MNFVVYKNITFLIGFVWFGSLYAVPSKKNPYKKLDSGEFEQLQKNNKDLKHSFNETRVDIKKRRNTIHDMGGFIEICKEGAQHHCEQLKKLRRNKSTGSFNLKKRWKIRRLKKEAQEIEKKALKMLTLQQECSEY